MMPIPTNLGGHAIRMVFYHCISKIMLIFYFEVGESRSPKKGGSLNPLPAVKLPNPPAMASLLMDWFRIWWLNAFMANESRLGSRARLSGSALGLGSRVQLSGSALRLGSQARLSGSVLGFGSRAWILGSAVGFGSRARLPGSAPGLGSRARLITFMRHH